MFSITVSSQTSLLQGKFANLHQIFSILSIYKALKGPFKANRYLSDWNPCLKLFWDKIVLFCLTLCEIHYLENHINCSQDLMFVTYFGHYWIIIMLQMVRFVCYNYIIVEQPIKHCKHCTHDFTRNICQISPSFPDIKINCKANFVITSVTT